MLSAKLRRPAAGALTASAAQINTSNPTDVLSHAVTQVWQREAWSLYDQLPQLHYPANYIGNSLSRFILRVGERNPDIATDPPNPDPKPRSVQFEMATDALAELNAGAGGQKEILRRWGVNATIAADCWMLGTDQPDSTLYELLSILEIEVRPDGTVFRHEWGPGQIPQQITPGFGLWRFWRAHPARSKLADSAMQALIGDCRRLVALNDSITSRLLSRLSQAGILAIPNSLTIPGATPPADGTNRGPTDPMLYGLLQAMENGILNRKSASGVIPIMLRGPDESVANLKHITLDRKIDDSDMMLRAELRETISQGLDLPPEAQTGLSQGSHFATWSVTDDSFRSHLFPLVEQLTEGLTRTYLWPYLAKLGVAPDDYRGLVIYPDGAEVVVRPNDAEDKRQMHDRFAVSDAALRRASAVPEDDAPDEDESVRMVGRKINNAFLATWGLAVHDQIPWDLVALGAQRPGNLAALLGEPGAGGGGDSDHPTDPSAVVAPVAGGQAPKAGVSSIPPSRRPVDNGTSTSNSPGANAGAPGNKLSAVSAGALMKALRVLQSNDPNAEVDLDDLVFIATNTTFDA